MEVLSDLESKHLVEQFCKQHNRNAWVLFWVKYMSSWANRTPGPHNLSSFVDFYILKSTTNRNAFLIIAWKFSGSLNSLAQVLKIAEWAQGAHKSVIVMVHEKEVLPHSFSGYGLWLHSDKQMKKKDTDHFYSEDASWVILKSWLLHGSGTLPFPLLLGGSSQSKHLISSGKVAFEFSVCLQGVWVFYYYYFFNLILGATK